jgi:HSP20 family protein
MNSSHAKSSNQGSVAQGRAETHTVKSPEAALEQARQSNKPHTSTSRSPEYSAMGMLSPFSWLTPAREADGFFDFPRQMVRMADQMFANLRQAQDAMLDSFAGGGLLARASMEPREDEYCFTVEMAGFSPSDVEVTLTGSKLLIIGNRQEESKRESSGPQARRFAHFERSFSLAPDSDPESAEATFHDGLLTITVPRRKQEKSSHRKLDIHHKQS